MLNHQINIMTTQNFHFLNAFHVTHFPKGVREESFTLCVSFSVMKIDTHTLCFSLSIQLFYHTLNFVLTISHDWIIIQIFRWKLFSLTFLLVLFSPAGWLYVLPFFSANHHFHLLPWILEAFPNKYKPALHHFSNFSIFFPFISFSYSPHIFIIII